MNAELAVTKVNRSKNKPTHERLGMQYYCIRGYRGRGEGIAVTLRKAVQMAFESMGKLKKGFQHIGERRHGLKKM